MAQDHAPLTSGGSPAPVAGVTPAGATAAPASAELHPALLPLAWLLGDWEGEGEGEYPTVADFRYTERQQWTHDGRPFLVYHQQSWADDDRRPLHRESGFLRLLGAHLELVIAHSFGIVEVATGEIGQDAYPHVAAVTLSSSALVSAPAARVVDGVRRTLAREGDTLHSTLELAFAGHPLQGHLDAALHPTGDRPAAD